MSAAAFDALRITARRRLLQLHYESKSGHIGSGLSALDALLWLYHRVLREEDYFLLSKAHAAAALYVTLWSAGKLSEELLATYYQDGTKLPGHTPMHWLKDIPFAGGSLGHGPSLAAGMALGLRLQNKPGRVFCLTSDGEWQEGAMWEALIFLVHHRLSHVTLVVDMNGLQGFGTTRETASLEGERLKRAIAGFGAEVVEADGHDAAALERAFAAPHTGPRVLLLQTVKGKGVSFMENQLEWHYRTLDDTLYAQARAELGAA